MLLITRPLDDALKTSNILNKAGFSTYVESMMKIKYLNVDFSTLSYKFDIIVFTSSNAIAIVADKIKKETNVITVGNHTMNTAKKFGFFNAKSVDGNVQEIVNYIKNSFDNCEVLYIRGKEISYDLKNAFNGTRINVREIIVYYAQYRKKFSSKLISLFLEESISGVLIYSLKTAEVFNELVVKHNLLNKIQHVVAYVFSEKIMKKVSEIKWKNILVAKELNQNSMISMIN